VDFVHQELLKVGQSVYMLLVISFASPECKTDTHDRFVDDRRPFTRSWWARLLATGVFMAGAVSVKLAGVLTAVLVGLFMLQDLWSLARRESISAVCSSL